MYRLIDTQEAVSRKCASGIASRIIWLIRALAIDRKLLERFFNVWVHIEDAIKVHQLEYFEYRPMNIRDSQGTIDFAQSSFGLHQGSQAFAGHGVELLEIHDDFMFFSRDQFLY